MLIWNFHDSNIVYRAVALRLGAGHEGENPEEDGGDSQHDGHYLSWRQIAFGGAEFLADIDARAWTQVDDWSRFWFWRRLGSG